MKIRTVGLVVLLAAAASSRATEYWWNGSTNNYASPNWERPSGTSTSAQPVGWDTIYNTKGGKVIVTSYKDPGYFKFATGELEIQAGGTLQPAGNGGGSIFDGPATQTVTGGTLRCMGPSGPRTGGATLNLRAGQWTVTSGSGAGFFASGGGTAVGTTPARIVHTGGTLASAGFSVVLGDQNMWAHQNGDYVFGDAVSSTGLFTGAGSLILGNIASKMNGSGYRYTTYGTFTGYGVVGLTGTLRNNGYVTADGYDTERTLDLSPFATVTSTVDNDQYKLAADNAFYYGKGGTGWFATRKGRLVLPPVAVAAGSGAVNWGEAAADTNIDLVNSVRITFADVAAPGTLSISLLATNRSEAADTTGTLIGLWEATAPGLAFASAVPVFRFDDALAAACGVAESDLKVYARPGPGAAWADMTSGVDTNCNQITASAVAGLGYFAVGTGLKAVVPGTVMLVR